jgi:hypothetical protein
MSEETMSHKWTFNNKQIALSIWEEREEEIVCFLLFKTQTINTTSCSQSKLYFVSREGKKSFPNYSIFLFILE